MTTEPLARPRRRTVLAFAGTAVALAAAWGAIGAAPGVADAARSGAPAPGSQYVALGDSYAAGYGIKPSTGKPVVGCAQSVHDYPHQVAATLRLELVDVSCSGAVTADIDQNGQDTGNGGGTAPQQDKALSSRTKLVTLSIGGNDLGFATIAAYCLAVTPKGPVAGKAADCKSKYGNPSDQADYLPTRIKNVVVPRVARVLADIEKKAPHAAVYFVDYPAISTTKAGSSNPALYPTSCFSAAAQPDSFPFTNTDIPFLQQIQQQLNEALKARVHESGDHFVESYPQSLPHSACAGTKDPWMNGITVQAGVSTSGPNVGGAPGSLHPNREGADHLAAETLAAIGPYVAPAPSPSHSAAPPGNTGAGTPGGTPAGAASAPLANSGYGGTLPMSALGSLLVVVGAALLFAARRARLGR